VTELADSLLAAGSAWMRRPKRVHTISSPEGGDGSRIGSTAEPNSHVESATLIVRENPLGVGYEPGPETADGIKVSRGKRFSRCAARSSANDVVAVSNPSAVDVDEDLVGCQRSRFVYFERLHFAAERADARY
jgi:hypothetical protein